MCNVSMYYVTLKSKCKISTIFLHKFHLHKNKWITVRNFFMLDPMFHSPWFHFILRTSPGKNKMRLIIPFYCKKTEAPKDDIICPRHHSSCSAPGREENSLTAWKLSQNCPEILEGWVSQPSRVLRTDILIWVVRGQGVSGIPCSAGCWDSENDS